MTSDFVKTVHHAFMVMCTLAFLGSGRINSVVQIIKNSKYCKTMLEMLGQWLRRTVYWL